MTYNVLYREDKAKIFGFYILIAVSLIFFGTIFPMITVGYIYGDISEVEYFLLFMLLVPVVLMLIAIIGIVKEKRAKHRVMKLAERGILVKGLDYEIKDTNVYVNGRRMYIYNATYITPNGEARILTSGKRPYDARECETIDVLFDKENPGDYYLDFNIDRVGGNRPEDYFDTGLYDNYQGEIKKNKAEEKYIEPERAKYTLDDQPEDNYVSSTEDESEDDSDWEKM